MTVLETTIRDYLPKKFRESTRVIQPDSEKMIILKTSKVPEEFAITERSIIVYSPDLVEERVWENNTVKRIRHFKEEINAAKLQSGQGSRKYTWIPTQ